MSSTVSAIAQIQQIFTVFLDERKGRFAEMLLKKIKKGDDLNKREIVKLFDQVFAEGKPTEEKPKEKKKSPVKEKESKPEKKSPTKPKEKKSPAKESKQEKTPEKKGTPADKCLFYIVDDTGIKGRLCMKPIAKASKTGKYCGAHCFFMENDDDKCRHFPDGGSRCQATRVDGTVFCKKHHPKNIHEALEDLDKKKTPKKLTPALRKAANDSDDESDVETASDREDSSSDSDDDSDIKDIDINKLSLVDREDYNDQQLKALCLDWDYADESFMREDMLDYLNIVYDNLVNGK